MTFWETVERGEYVMIALAVILIVVVCIWWVRGAWLGKQKKIYHTLMQRVRDHVMEGDIENAGQICDSVDSPVARLLCSGIHSIGEPMPEVRSRLQEVKEIELSRFSEGDSWLRAFAVISPLLGLGGTLTGVIDRLRDLGEAGGGVDISAVCGAIAPTIVTTVAGLGVGIFALIASTGLERSISSTCRLLETAAADFTGLLNEPT